jgi:hypothetical protein
MSGVRRHVHAVDRRVIGAYDLNMSNNKGSAIITAISGLAGAAIGGAVTILATQLQINSDKAQAFDAFLLNQRQAAFAGFLTDAGDFAEDQYSYVPHSKASASLESRIVSAANKIDKDSNSVILVSPSNISTVATEMSSLAGLIAIKEGLVTTITPQPSRSSRQELLRKYRADLNNLRVSMSDLITKG